MEVAEQYPECEVRDPLLNSSSSRQETVGNGNMGRPRGHLPSTGVLVFAWFKFPAPSKPDEPRDHRGGWPRAERGVDCGHLVRNPPKPSIILLTDRTLQVVGIDVYPYPVPEDIPPNLDFQVDDLNSP